MKRFLQILMLAAALCLPWAMQAQQTLTVHDGTTTNGYVPVYGYYADAYLNCQMVYPASELSQMSGKQITALTFYQSASSGWSSTSVQVYMAEVSSSTISAFQGLSDLTLVWQGSLSGSSANTNISLSTPYQYQGGNLLIAVVNATTGVYSSCNWYGETVTGASYQGYSYNDVASCSGSQQNFLPKTTFAYLNPGACLSPTSVTASSVNATSASISWTSTASNFIVAYGTGTNPDSMATMTTTTTSAALTGLTSLTHYNVYVKSVCGAGDTSAWSTSCGFSTTAVPTLVNSANPYTQGFEGTNDFYFVNGACTNAWATGSATSNSGTNALYVSNDGGTSNAYDNGSTSVSFATKLFQLGAGTYHYSFDWKGYGESGYDYMRVALVPASVNFAAGTLPSGLGSSSTPAGWSAIDGGSQLSASSSWQTRSGDVVVADSGLYNLVFVWRNDGSVGNNPPAAVDNISFTMPSCSTPGAAVATNVAATTADLSWAAGSATQSNFIVAYGTGTNPDLMPTVNAATTSTTLTGLTPNATYNVFVKAVCSATEQSEWSVMASFHTPCVVADSAIFFEGAEGTTGSDLPDCWTTGHIYKAVSHNNPPFYTGTSTKIGMRGFVLRDMTSGNISYLCSQAIDFEQLGKYSFRYQYYRPSGTSSLGEGLKVFVTPTPGDTANAVVVIPFVNRYAGNSPVGTAGWNTYEGVINYQDTGYIMVVGYSKYGSSSYFDNLEVYLSPSCLHVGQVALSNISATSVDVAWQLDDTTQNNFVVAYGAGTDPDNMTAVNAATTSTTLTGLTPNTPYNVFVKAVCSATDHSEWSQMASFRTTVDCGTGYAYKYGVIGTGTYTSYYAFAYAYGTTSATYANGISGYIYTASDMQAFNLYSNNQLQGIKVQAAGTGSLDLTIFVAHTDKAQITSTTDTFTYANMTQVFNGTASFTSGEWAALMFDQPFAYDADSNLAVVIRRNAPATVTIPVYYTSTGSNYYAYYDYKSATAAAFGTCTRTYNRPNMGFVFCSEVPSCAPVNMVTATNIAATSADIDWQLDDTAQFNFVVAYGAGTDPDNMTTVNAATTYTTLTGLTPATTYNVFVKAVCSATDQSEWSSMITFATTAVPATVPYICGFEDAADNSSWLTVAGSGVNHFVIGTDTNAVRSGANALYVADATGSYGYNTSSSTKTFAYRPIQLAVGTYAIDFDWTCTGGESTWDFGSVMILAADQPLVGGAGSSYTSTTWPNYLKRCEPAGKQFFNLTSGQNSYSGTFTITNPGIYNIAVMWSNDASAGTANYPLAVDNISIQQIHTLTVAANDTTMGAVTGSGVYAAGDTATLTATPNAGYRFVSWNDGDTNAIRTIIVTADSAFTATFAINQHTLTVSANHTAMGIVTGAGVYNDGDTATLTATANTGYHFVNWNDGDTNAIRTVIVTADATYIANFASNQYTVTAAANDTAMGTVTGSGSYLYGTAATLTAVANANCYFVSWNDGNTNATRQVIVTSDSTFTATFATCVQTLPVAYGFEASEGFANAATTTYSTVNHFGVCWRNEATVQTGTNGTRLWTIYGGTSASCIHSGSRSLLLPDKSVGNMTMLAFPAINITSATGATVRLWVNRATGTPKNPMEGFAIYASATDTIDANADSIGFCSRYINDAAPRTEAAAGWYQYEFQVNRTGITHIIFEGHSQYGMYTCVDDIEIFATPTCLSPVGVEVSNVDVATATVSWTPRDTAQHNFTIAYGTGTNPDSMTTITAATASANLTGLTPNTPYNVFVKAVCSATDQSTWSQMASFRTNVDCGAGYIYRYDVIGNGISSSYTPFTYAYGTTSTSYAQGISGYIYTAQDMQALNLYSNNQLQGIKVQAAGTGSLDLTIFVAHTDKAQIASTMDTFTYANMTQVFNGTASFTSGQWAALMFDQPFAYDADSNLAVVIRRNAPTSISIPVYYTSTSPNYYAYYDYKSATTAAFGTCSRTYNRPNMGFVFCTEAPACMPVHGVAVSNITDASADVAWQIDDTAQHNFTVAYGIGTNPDSMTTVAATTNGAALAGLAPATTYNLFVRTNCNDTTSSTWSYMVTFATTAVPATVPYICGFEDAADNSSWLTVAGAGVNHFVIGTDTNAVRSGANALYVADATGSYGYNTSSSTKTFAYRPVQLAAGTYAIDFDWSCTGGESTYDFGSVMILSADQPLVGGAGVSYSGTTWPNYLKRCEPATKQFFNLTEGQNSYSGSFTVTNPGIYNIAVMWSNDGSVGTANFPLAVDNISIQQAYTLTVAANNDTMGTVTGSGVYADGDTATLTATANAGYRFVNWNDGDTSRIRTVVVTADASYTAIFAGISQYVINASANDDAMGTVTGSGVYNAGDTVTLTATANTGYHFVNWNDGDTNATRTIIVTADAAYMANFANNQYTVTVAANDTTMGTVTGAGVYNEGATATLTATANTGYHFVSWNDGDTNATRTVVVMANATYTATFAANQYTLTVLANDNTMGTVTGSGIYTYNSTATLTAVANAGYHFVNWSDSNMNATRQVVVTGDASYTANFAVDDSVIVVLSVNDSAMGYTNPAAGTYVFHVGDTAQSEAIAASGYHFVSWTVSGMNNPVATNPIVMVVDSTMLNMTFNVTANFAQDTVIPATYTITLDVNDTTMGYVTGAGEYAEGATAIIAAVAYEGFRFVNWSDGDMNDTRTITVGCDLSFTANFAVDSTAMLIVTANDTMGYVLINGESMDDNTLEGMLGDTVTLEAVANDGYHFVAWSDGDTSAVRTVILDASVIRLTAEFAQNVGIIEVETAEYTIYSISNRIVVRGAEQQPVYVFDVVGRLVAQTSAAAVEQTFTMSHTGIYLVKVANNAAKRVVVR